MLALVRKHPRCRYRRIAVLVGQDEEFHRVNVKRVYRLWREQGLRVPVKQRRHLALYMGPPGDYPDYVYDNYA